jgi:hypothetical protein
MNRIQNSTERLKQTNYDPRGRRFVLDLVNVLLKSERLKSYALKSNEVGEEEEEETHDIVNKKYFVFLFNGSEKKAAYFIQFSICIAWKIHSETRRSGNRSEPLCYKGLWVTRRCRFYASQNNTIKHVTTG